MPALRSHLAILRVGEAKSKARKDMCSAFQPRSVQSESGAWRTARLGETMNEWIRTDGTTVWVDVGAYTVGRFGKLGIDVHTADATGCLHCTHEPTTKDDWHVFVAAMFLHHNVNVTDEFMPERFR